MKVYFAADHGGYETKNKLVEFVGRLGYEVEDCGAHEYDPADDYPEIIARAARKISEDEIAGRESRAIIAGGSGQGEAMVANRFKHVRCGVYYGEASRKQTDTSGKQLDMLASTRVHNNANALSLGLRFLTLEEAKEAVRKWLETPFPGEDRHVRRIRQLDEISGM
jgi:ribose 5-phosphate isomerase B